MRPRRPNVVLFITHDTGRAVSPCGYATVQTPHCERLAAEGVRFDRCFSVAPLCCPARATCVTGRYPHQNGVMGLTSEHLGGWDLRPGERHAAAIFRDAGYDAILCGFEHETPHWQDHGFSAAISGPGGWFNGGGDLRDHAREIDGFLAHRDAARPFYLQIGCHETHHDWSAFQTAPDDARGVTVPPWLRDIPEVRAELASFQGAVRRLDECLGAILDVLEARGVGDDTLFVFTTDHGIDFPRAKGTLYDAGIGVFLFLRYPRGGWGAGRAVDSMVSHIDLLPTLLEACDIDPPDNLAGRSLVPLLDGRRHAPAEAIFAGKTYHDSYDPSRAVRTAQFKYIRHFEVNIFDDLRLATETRRHFLGVPWIRRGHEELYDLGADPLELRNLVPAGGHEAALAEMRRLLLEHMRSTRDPLLDGYVPNPTHQRRLRAFRGD